MFNLEKPTFNFGHIVNGNAMEFSRDFSDSGWRPDGRLVAENNKLVDWYHEVDLSTNSFGFRSDDFLEPHEHVGKHILFAGCSVTWGDGQNREETWPLMVYQELSKTTKLSGYFNIGFPGMSIIQEIFWMFKYFKKFGNPDTIFFLMPNPGRFVSVNPKTHNKTGVGSSMLTDELVENFPGTLKLVRYMTYEIYSMLEQYCQTNNISLISSTWSTGDRDDKTTAVGNTQELFDTGEFESFFTLSDPKQRSNRYMFEYMETHPEATLVSRDGSHPGTAQHAFFAKRMLDRYRELVDENIGI